MGIFLSVRILDEAEKYIEASWKARLILALLVLVSATLWVTGDNLEYIFGYDVNLSPAEREKSIDRIVYYGNFVGAASFIFYVGFSLIILRLGIRTHLSDQYPPPKSMLLIRTKVKSGNIATGIAISCYLVSIIIFCWSMYWLSRLLT